MKKILPFLLIAFFLLPSDKGLAYTNGYFDYNSPLPVMDKEIVKMYDNDLLTGAQISGYGKLTIVADLPEGVDIVEYYYNGSKSNFMSLEFLDTNNSLIKTIVSSSMQEGWNKLDPTLKNAKYIRVKNTASGAYEIKEFDIKVVAKNESVTSVSERHDFDSVTLSWVNPSPASFDGVIIKKNGVKIADLDNQKSSFIVSDLTASTKYDFEIITKYPDGSMSEPIIISATTDTPVPAEDIKNLKATADYNRVDLSWNLPASENFKHVNIYRYEVQQTALIDKILMIKTASAAATGKKIFETNGTYFNDLTVNPETTYQYTLTTTSTDLIESVGVSKTVTTPKKPKPEIGGGEFEKDPATGSYIYRWTEPTTGKVKVMVGGKLYTTVNASNKVVVIPAKDMKFKGLDEPDVYLIPVSEDGEEGTPVKPPAVGGGTGGMLDDVDLPFNAGELLGTGTGLFWLIGPFVLLALAFLLVPKLRNSMVHAFTGNKDALTDTDRRSRDVTERAREERMRVAREREVNTTREPIERQQRAVRASRERVHKARMSREERRTT